MIFQEGRKSFSVDCWTHDIEKLVKLADLEAVWITDTTANAMLRGNWGVVTNWDEKSRYRMKTQVEAEELYNAIAENANGVMQWIRARW